MIQETLGGSSRHRRVRLHGRIAEALEALYGEDVEHTLPARLPLRKSGDGPRAGEAHPLLPGRWRAGLTAHAHEQAIAHFQRGLTAKGDAAMDDETAGSTSASVAPRSPRSRAYELEPAATSLRRAFDYYAQVGDVSRADQGGSPPDSPFAGTGVHGLPGVDRTSLGTLVAADSHEAGQLLAQHGWYSGIVEADYKRGAAGVSACIVDCTEDRTTRPSSGGHWPMPPGWTCGDFRSSRVASRRDCGRSNYAATPATSRPRSTLADPSCGR